MSNLNPLQLAKVNQQLLANHIPTDKIRRMNAFTDKIPMERWEQMFNEMKNLDQNGKNQLIDMILDKYEKQSSEGNLQKTPDSSNNSAFPIQSDSTNMKKMRSDVKEYISTNQMLMCSSKTTDGAESLSISDKDQCDGAALFVCHHCGKPFCNAHTYWIPDHEFPFVVKREDNHETVTYDVKKLNKAKMLFAFGILASIIGFFIIVGVIMAGGGYGIYIEDIGFLVLGILLLIGGIPLIVFGVKIKKEVMNNPIITGVFYPRYSQIQNSKWGSDTSNFYEHRGYYTAVHCWDCLIQNHKSYYELLKSIHTELKMQIINWRKKGAGGESIELSPYEVNQLSNYGANLLLHWLKVVDMIPLPTGGILRAMIKPKEFMGRPTPVWLFPVRNSPAQPTHQYNLKSLIGQILSILNKKVQSM